MTEIWRPVPGYSGYEISDLGGLRSSKRGPNRILRTTVDRGGYSRVQLYRDGKPRRLGIHQLVALAFIGPRPAGKELRHLDGNSQRNEARNLAYGTSTENNRDTVDHGTNRKAAQKNCLRGHPLTDENTARLKQANGRPQRRCRKCAALRARLWRATRKNGGRS